MVKFVYCLISHKFDLREKVNIRKNFNMIFEYFTPPVLILFSSASLNIL
jgi:hypothetical protein